MNAFKSFFIIMFSSATSWLNAVDKLGKAVENLTTIAEESSGTYADIARIERRANATKRLTELGITDVEEVKLLLSRSTAT